MNDQSMNDTNPQGFAYYETEATRLAGRIRDLKGLTPEFIEVRDTAQRQMEHHFRLIEQEEATLADLRQQAAQAAMLLGVEVETEADGIVSGQAHNRYIAVEGKMYVDTSTDPVAGVWGLPALADLSAEEQAEIEAILNDDTPFEGIAAEQANETTVATVGDIAEQITAALADMAINQPDTPDQSDAPELTTEQVERVEDSIAEALKAYA
jgi:hypothetical protein